MNTKLAAIFVVVLVATLTFWFFYTTTTTTTTTERLYPGKVTIGHVPWPGYLGLYVAIDKGYFADAGLDVEIRSYASLADASRDYQEKKIQGKANLNSEAIQEAYQGLDHKVVLVIDHSNGADGIIASRKIADLSALKGKRVAFEVGTLEEFFLHHALDAYSLDIKDIVSINLNPEKAAEALVSGSADVAVTYEPYMSRALNESGGHLIYSSADAPGLIVDMLTFHSDFVRQYPDTVERIIKAYFKAFQFWKEHPEEAHVILAKHLGITPDDAKKQLEGVRLLSLLENKTTFTFSAGVESLYGNMRQTAEFIKVIQGATSTRMIDSDTLIDPSFIKNLFR